MKCPECGSKRVTKAGFSWRARQKVQRMRCIDCGRLFTVKSADEVVAK